MQLKVFDNLQEMKNISRVFAISIATVIKQPALFGSSDTKIILRK